MTAQLYIAGRGLVDAPTLPDSGSRVDLTGREAGRCTWPRKDGDRETGRWRAVARAAEAAPDGRKRVQREALAVLIRLFDALDRLPADGLFPAGYGTAMPEAIREARESYGWSDTPVVPAIPGAREIAEIDRMAQYLLTLAPADRRILSGLGYGLRYDVIARKVGLSVAMTRERGDALLLSFAAEWGARQAT